MLAGLDAVLLAGADAPRHAVLTSTMVLDFTQPHDPPRQLGVGPLGRRSAAASVTTRQSAGRLTKWCGVLHQPTAADLAQVERSGVGAGASSSRVFLRFGR